MIETRQTILNEIYRSIEDPDNVELVSLKECFVDIEDKLQPDDPFIHILFAFGDSICIPETPNQIFRIQQAFGILDYYSNLLLITPDKISKAVMELENIGFDTTPIPLNIT